VISRFSDRSPAEIVDLLNSLQVSSHKKWDYYRALDGYLEKLGTRNLEYLETYKQLPVMFYGSVVSIISKMDPKNMTESDIDNIRETFLWMLDNAINEDGAISRISYGLSSFFVKNNLQRHYNCIAHTMIDICKRLTSDEETIDQDPIMYTVNNGYIVFHNTLILFCTVLKETDAGDEFFELSWEYFDNKLNDLSDWRIRCAIAYESQNFLFTFGEDRISKIELFTATDRMLLYIMACFFFRTRYSSKLFIQLVKNERITKFISSPEVRNYHAGSDLINRAAEYIFYAYLKDDTDLTSEKSAISQLIPMLNGGMLTNCFINATGQLTDKTITDIEAKVDRFLSKVLVVSKWDKFEKSLEINTVFDYISRVAKPTRSLWEIAEIVANKTEYLYRGDIVWEVLNKYIDDTDHHKYVIKILFALTYSLKDIDRKHNGGFFKLINQLQGEEKQIIRTSLINRGKGMALDEE